MIKKIIYTFILFSIYITNVNGLEINRLNYYLDTNYTFNITGNIDGGTINTSYSGSNILPEYYNTYVKIDNSEKRISNITNNTRYLIKENIYITHTFTYDNNNKTIILEYKIDNDTNKDIVLKLATISDIDFTSSDNISIYKDDNNIYLTDDNTTSSTYGLQFNINYIDKPSNIWIGNYNKLLDSKYISSSINYINNIDSSFAYSYDIEIKSNTSITKKVSFTMNEALKKTINIHNINNNIEVKEGLLGSSFTLPETSYIYNTKEDGSGDYYNSLGRVVITNNISDIYEISINPKTGDNIIIYISLVIISLILMIILIKKYKIN